MQIMTVCLLYEMGKGKNSFWYPYLKHLPRSYEILATFSEFEKQALQVDDAIWTTEKAISKAESEWKRANLLMQELKLKSRLLSLRAWIWASATISSRTLHIPWDDVGCLCPVGDLFNYAAPGEESNGIENVESLMHSSSLQDHSLSTEHSTDNLPVERYDAHIQRLTDGRFDEDFGAYCFYARNKYKKGEQVLLIYGTYTNLELLEHYGFLLKENPNDKVFIPLEPSMYSSNSWPKESMYIHQDGKPSFALLSALRLWAIPQGQRRSMGHLAYSGSQLSVENEISVLKWISQNCHVILNNLPTTVEGDSMLLCTIDKILNFRNPKELGEMLCRSESEACAFLEASSLQKKENGAELLLCSKTKRSAERWKLAVDWRLRYKKILTDCISHCTEIINSFSSQNVSTVRTQ
ncbi:hypothetical protein P3X46_016103 [Hevea brasiliensis]|uniref:Rubisco LSMT substrate-binding domain-containing protein n=1 Tax=Hevea brasiliensis TaxID=3981 RepID=A0ABQ9M235_HEVBR|nr:hypothetical protein P3X46_016103 [Hevea brasiliensis]